MSEGHGQIGHNGVAGKRLRSFIERVERLESDKKEIATEISEVYAEAKGEGFDTATMRQIVKLRRLSREERAEQEALLETYLHALGMLAGTPLGEAAIKAFGQPVPLTGDEKAKGMAAAFIDDDGTRVSLGMVGRQTDLEEHIEAAGEGERSDARSAGGP